MTQALVLYNSHYMTNLLGASLKNTEWNNHQKKLMDQIIQNQMITDLNDLIDLYSTLTSQTNQIPFRRLSGAGNLPGLFDALAAKNISIKFVALNYYLEHYSKFENIDFIIAPMTMQDIPDLYNITDELHIPVFPRTTPLWESKINQRFLMSEVLPEVLLPFAYIKSLRDITDEQLSMLLNGLETHHEKYPYIFIKDDEGFHSGSTFPYYHGKIEDFERLVSNYGSARLALIIEPLIFFNTGKKPITRIIKIHGFNTIHKEEYLVYNVYWKSLEGKYGPDTIDRIERIEREIDLSAFPFSKLSQFVKAYLPFNLTSLDFAVDVNGNFYCIDINHAAGTWGEVQEMNRLLSNTIFDKMVDVMCSTIFESYKIAIDRVNSSFSEDNHETRFVDFSN